MVKTSVLPPVGEVGTLDRDRLQQLRRLGYLLDDAIPIPGTSFRVGLEAIIGLVPGIGDLVGGGFSAYIILQAARMGVPRSLLARMGWNLLVDVIVGDVPFLGDLFDAGFKANLRNLALLERHARNPVETRRAGRLFIAGLGLVLGLVLVGAFALTIFLLQAAFGRTVL
jgi:hypothetical protein